VLVAVPARASAGKFLGQEGGYDVVRHVDHVADAEIDGHTADDVGLLAAPAALLQQVDHVEHGIAAGQGEILPLVHAVLANGPADGRGEALRRRPLGRREVAAVSEARPASQARGGSLHDAKAHGDGGAHLDGGDADLAVALGEVAIAHGEQRALYGDGEQQGRALRELLDVEVPAVLPRRNGPQPSLGHRALNGHGSRAVGRQGEAAPPARTFSRRVHASSYACEGATPDTPMNDAPECARRAAAAMWPSPR
jgi:hypothetical protein